MKLNPAVEASGQVLNCLSLSQIMVKLCSFFLLFFLSFWPLCFKDYLSILIVLMAQM